MSDSFSTPPLTRAPTRTTTTSQLFPNDRCRLSPERPSCFHRTRIRQSGFTRLTLKPRWRYRYYKPITILVIYALSMCRFRVRGRCRSDDVTFSTATTSRRLRADCFQKVLRDRFSDNFFTVSIRRHLNGFLKYLKFRFTSMTLYYSTCFYRNVSKPRVHSSTTSVFNCYELIIFKSIPTYQGKYYGNTNISKWEVNRNVTCWMVVSL